MPPQEKLVDHCYTLHGMYSLCTKGDGERDLDVTFPAECTIPTHFHFRKQRKCRRASAELKLQASNASIPP